jgi:replicative DNA helicase
MPHPNGAGLELDDRTTDPRDTGAAPPLLSTGTLLGNLLQDLAARHQTRHGGGWTGGLRCGFRLFDKELRGLRPRSVTLLNAEPTIGKSTLTNQIAYQVAAFESQKAAAVCAAFEDDPAHLLLKQLARLSGWSIDDLEDGRISPNDPQLLAAVERLAAAPLFYLRGNSATTPEVLIERLAEAKEAAKADATLLCVDYLQYFARHTNGRTQIEQIGIALSGLAHVADTSGAALLVVASQNRETNKNGGATLYGGRGSGEIEYDADVLLSMTREKDADNERRLLVVKNRFGAAGAEAKLTFTKERGLFEQGLTL